MDVAATRQLALRALAPLAMMGLIYFLSAQPDLDSGLGVLDLILRKLAHATEYALLALLWAWALRPVTRWNVAAAAVIAVLYAASDEFHQTFVEGRHGAGTDLLVDFAGVLLAIALLRYHRALRTTAGSRGSGVGSGRGGGDD
ncbi:MAG TPA: VanZ family protein [Solirubrobacterales bacterium]